MQPPCQPLKTEPCLGVAISVTIVSLAYASLQSVPQFTPGVEVVMVPEPLP